MIPPLYRGSVKDLLGPVPTPGGPALVFEYTDSYSVFDWGRMPDALKGKGSALAVMAADWFEALEKPQTWREFSKTPEAHALRKNSRFGADFVDRGEKLQQEGLRTHYISCLKAPDLQLPGKRLDEIDRAGGVPRHILVKQVGIAKPKMTSVMGRSVPDYSGSWNVPAPRLVPLEVVFRFSCPSGSSLRERMKADPTYLSQRGFSEITLDSLEAGAKWDFPVLELFTKLESSDRPVTLGEALAICGLKAEQLNELLFKTAWVAALLKQRFGKCGLELADGKLEWGVAENGECFLVDAIGPDELRLLKDGIQLSKEFLRAHYRGTEWYGTINLAKKHATDQGIADWKRLVPNPPPALPAKHRDIATQMYLALTNAVTGRDWFPDAWTLTKVVEELRSISTPGGSR